MAKAARAKVPAKTSRPAAKSALVTRGTALATRAGKSLRPHVNLDADAWPYAAAPESVKVNIKPRYGHFINGQFVPSASGATITTINPASEQVLSTIARGGAADVDAAVRAARAALPAWSALPGLERGKLLFRLARRIKEVHRELAVLETLDGGKPIKESRDVDVPLASHHFFYYAGWADKLNYAMPGSTGSTGPQPVGVCGQIIPWNFPLMMAAWKLAPALACGNTCILKPAETTSLSALRLAELMADVGFPPGVVNIVTGDGQAGAALASHSDVDKIAFTGSTEVGKRIATAAAGTRKKLTLELGGKSANIVFEDASIDQAVEGIIEGIYFNQGHVCCAGSRLFVQESIADKLIAKLTLRLSSLRIGDPMDKNTDVGAINSRQQLESINRYIEIGKQEGCQLVRPERGALPNEGNTGSWCRPCFFTGVQPNSRLAREEIFGPVLAVMTFRTADEAISRANNTPYGLAAGVWTNKGAQSLHVARALEAGVIWLNTYNKFDAASPFGGMKESGFGREGGLHGLRGYLK